MAIHLVVAKIIISIVMGFSSRLPITLTSDPLAITNLVPEISGMDPDTFTLAKAEVSTFQEPFRL